MVRRMSAREARANFSDLLGTVFYTNEPVIVERKGKPFAVVISPEQYRVMQAELGAAWQSVDEVRTENRDIPAEQVLQQGRAFALGRPERSSINNSDLLRKIPPQ